MADLKDYEVGYGKPPRANQFQKGQSGNPKGRPKGCLNTATLSRKLMAEQITVTENGRQRRMSMHEVLLRQVLRKAAKGDIRSARMMLQLIEQEEVLPEIEVGGPDVSEQDGVLVHKALLKMHNDLLREGGLESLSA